MLSKLIISLYCLEERKIRCFQRRSLNEAEEAMPLRKNLLRLFIGVLHQSQLFENKR